MTLFGFNFVMFKYVFFFIEIPHAILVEVPV